MGRLKGGGAVKVVRKDRVFKSQLGGKVLECAALADTMIRKGNDEAKIKRVLKKVLNMSSDETMRAITLLKKHDDTNLLQSDFNLVYSTLSQQQIEYFTLMSDVSVERDQILSELRKRNDEMSVLQERMRNVENEAVIIQSILDKRENTSMGFAILKEVLVEQFKESMDC
jgi:hypothetical protein